MMTSKNVLLSGLALIALTACSNTKDKLGLTKTAPDEFAVVRRAPLEMPPSYDLRPPQPGAPRPQEEHTSAQAREVVFGGTSNTPAPKGKTSAEAMLLERTGADQANPNIRATVNREAATWDKHKQPVAKRLLNLGKDDAAPATVVDAAAERARIEGNQAAGRAATAGETPSRED